MLRKFVNISRSPGMPLAAAVFILIVALLL